MTVWSLMAAKILETTYTKYVVREMRSGISIKAGVVLCGLDFLENPKSITS